jgi:hypothetical protein
MKDESFDSTTHRTAHRIFIFQPMAFILGNYRMRVRSGKAYAARASLLAAGRA